MYAHRQPSLAVNLTINRLDIQVTYHFHVLYTVQQPKRVDFFLYYFFSHFVAYLLK